MPKFNIQMTALVSSIALLGLAACESNGRQRVASIGTPGSGGANGDAGQDGQDGAAGDPGTAGQPGSDAGDGSSGPQVAGPAGPTGPRGPAGPQGPAGPGGEDGQLLALGDAGIIAAGGLVGGEGVAGTGLLANTGDPNNTIPGVSDLLVNVGETGTQLSAATTQVATLVDSALPGSTPLAGTVVGVVENTSLALVDTGNGEQYLVDGLTAAPGELINVTLGEAYALGSPEAQPLIGASVLSPDQTSASLLGAGVLSDNKLVSLSPGGDAAVLQPVTDGVNAVSDSLASGLGSDSLSDVGGTVQGTVAATAETVGGLQETAGDLLSGDGLSEVGGTVEGLVSGNTDSAAGLEDTAGSLLSGVGDTVEGVLAPATEDSQESDPVSGLLGGLLGSGD